MGRVWIFKDGFIFCSEIVPKTALFLFVWVDAIHPYKQKKLHESKAVAYYLEISIQHKKKRQPFQIAVRLN